MTNNYPELDGKIDVSKATPEQVAALVDIARLSAQTTDISVPGVVALSTLVTRLRPFIISHDQVAVNTMASAYQDAICHDLNWRPTWNNLNGADKSELLTLMETVLRELKELGWRAPE
jgi:hypothetical protein